MYKRKEQTCSITRVSSRNYWKSIFRICASNKILPWLFQHQYFPHSLNGHLNHPGHHFYNPKTKQVTTHIWKRKSNLYSMLSSNTPTLSPVGFYSARQKYETFMCVWESEKRRIQVSVSKLTVSSELAGPCGDFTAMIVIKDICWILIGAFWDGLLKRCCLGVGQFLKRLLVQVIRTHI